MFTGIIETTGEVKEISSAGTNKTFWVESALSNFFAVDQSIAHDGVCLTIEEVRNNRHKVTAIAETLEKTSLDHWHAGSSVNLERSLLAVNRIDGHFVQGHIDCMATCISVSDKEGSYELAFEYQKKFAPLVIEKGSIAINGISLTLFEVKKKTFRVAIIPYTMAHTNLRFLKEGSRVNIEFDMIGKYIVRNSAFALNAK